jgi:uncharacterized ParB-like nuclease family protein
MNDTHGLETGGSPPPVFFLVDMKPETIELRRIAPLACRRPWLVPLYMAMLKAGKRPPPVWLERARRRGRYHYRIIEGAHRVRAARRVGHTTVEAYIVDWSRPALFLARGRQS